MLVDELVYWIKASTFGPSLVMKNGDAFHWSCKGDSLIYGFENLHLFDRKNEFTGLEKKHSWLSGRDFLHLRVFCPFGQWHQRAK